MRETITLECTVCKNRNYTTSKNKKLHQDRLENFLQGAGIDKNVRPEDLSLEQFASLSNYLDTNT